MENFLIILGLFFLCLIIFSLISFCLYLVLKFLQQNTQFYPTFFTKKRLKILSIVITIYCSGYFAFTAVYPTDSFYFGEFETITTRTIPNSAKILTKSATYPDLHGDYESKATIELSTSDYQQLFEQIQQDKRFERLANEPNKIEFLRMIENREDRFYYVSFYQDGKTIDIHLENL